jgi:hypothetical protein
MIEDSKAPSKRESDSLRGERRFDATLCRPASRTSTDGLGDAAARGLRLPLCGLCTFAAAAVRAAFNGGGGKRAATRALANEQLRALRSPQGVGPRSAAGRRRPGWRSTRSTQRHTHARTHARTRAHTHARTHTRTHARTHSHLHTYTRTHTHTHARTHARAHTTHTHTRHTHTHAHALTRTRTHANTHTYTHTHTHTHTHAAPRTSDPGPAPAHKRAFLARLAHSSRLAVVELEPKPHLLM